MCLSGYQAKSFAPICYSPLQKKATQDTEHRGLGLWQHFRKDAHNMMLVSPPCFGTQAAMLGEADCQSLLIFGASIEKKWIAFQPVSSIMWSSLGCFTYHVQNAAPSSVVVLNIAQWSPRKSIHFIHRFAHNCFENPLEHPAITWTQFHLSVCVLIALWSMPSQFLEAFCKNIARRRIDGPLNHQVVNTRYLDLRSGSGTGRGHGVGIMLL